MGMYDGSIFLGANNEVKEKFAEEFSEGSEYLKKLLLLLWDNNISTHACCAGHVYDDGVVSSYINIDPSKIEKKDLLKILAALRVVYKNNIDIDYTFCNSKLKEVESYLNYNKSLVLYFTDKITFKEVYNIFFSIIDGKEDAQLDKSCLNKGEYQFIKDLVELTCVDRINSLGSSLFDKIAEVEISLEDGKKYISVGSEERVINLLYISKDKTYVFTPHTYHKKDGKYYILTNSLNIIEVDEKYISENNLVSSDESNDISFKKPYSHGLFMKIMKNINSSTKNKKIIGVKKK